LKLIVMMSLSIHMMTSQGRICARCVTKKYILEKSCIHVLSVRNVLLIGISWVIICLFTAVNTSALNVESALAAIMT